MIPARMPTRMQITIARIIFPVEIKIGKSKAIDIILVKINTSKMPINPPMMHKKALSNKNSVSMILGFAPIAFVNPLCDVLSFTVTNIILANPKIPTIKLNNAMSQPQILILANS